MTSSETFPLSVTLSSQIFEKPQRSQDSILRRSVLPWTGEESSCGIELERSTEPSFRFLVSQRPHKKVNSAIAGDFKTINFQMLHVFDSTNETRLY